MEDATEYEKIERFLREEMTDEERQTFLQEMQREEQLRTEVALHQKVTEVLGGEKIHDFRNLLQETNETWENKKSIEGKVVQFKYKKVLQFAAAILLLLFGVWTFQQWQPLTNEELFAQNFEPYSMVLNQRAVGDNPQKVALVNAAIAQYSKRNFSAATVSFRQLAVNYPNDIAFQFYEGLSLLANQNATQATPIFQQILQVENHLFLEQTKWYLALCHLKNKEIQPAQKVLERIKEGEFKYEQALIILEEIKD